MAKLNQIIAIEKGIKGQSYSALTELNKALQKPALFNGFSKQYQPKDADGETLPAENQRVQFNAMDAMAAAKVALSSLMTVTARKDWSNCVAKADVIIDGTVLVPQAPVSFLLFLEKQLSDIRAFVGNLPVLDPAEDWTKDENSGLYKTQAIQTHRTKKMQKPIVLYDATDKHPAQTQLITEDIIVGYWNQVKQSGAIPLPVRQTMLERIDKIVQAVKQAREAANAIDEDASPDVGGTIFSYVMGG